MTFFSSLRLFFLRTLLACLLSGWAGDCAAQSWQWAFQADTVGTVCFVKSLDSDLQGNAYSVGEFRGPVQFGPYSFGANWRNGVFISKFTPTGRVVWARQLVEPRADSLGFPVWASSAVDSEGNTYIAGTYRDTLTVGPFHLTPPAGRWTEAYFLASIDSAGAWRWLEQLPFKATTMAIDAPNNRLFLSGPVSRGAVTIGPLTLAPTTASARGGIVALELSTRQFVWATALTTDATVGSWYGRNPIMKIASDAHGGLFVTGCSTGPVLPFSGAGTAVGSVSETYIGAIDSVGQWRWVRSLSTGHYPRVKALVAAGNGRGVYAAIEGDTMLTIPGLPPPTSPDFQTVLARLNDAGQWQEAWPLSPRWEITIHQLLPLSNDKLVVAAFAFGSNPLAQLAGIQDGGPTSSISCFDPMTGQWIWAAAPVRTDSDLAVRYNRSLSVAKGLGSTFYLGGDFSIPRIRFGNTSLVWNNPPPTDATLFVAAYQASLIAVSAPVAGTDLTLYPNPAHTTVHLTVAATTAADQPLTVSDALGRVVRRQALAAGQTEAEVDVRGLPAGLYSVRCGGVGRRLVVE